jgi:hypothetical protein
MVTKSLLHAGLAIFLISGCTSQAPQQVGASARATHYWESTASSKQYRSDHASCEQRTEIDANGELDPNSTSFEAYRDCMIEQGYTLRNY